jgi:hypothetical protein
MAVILRALNLKNVYGQNYNVEIIDLESTVESPAEIDVNSEGIVIQYQGSTDDPHSRIITSTVTVTFVLTDPEIHEFIIQRLIDAKEGILFLRVYDFPFTYWQGPIVADRVQWEDMSYPFEITISANDGIGNLKGYEYKNPIGSAPGNIFGNLRVQTHLSNILKLLQYDDLYAGPFDIALQTNCYWYESKMANTTDDPLTMCYLSYWTFTDEDGLNTYKYMSAYDALHMICTIFNARFYYAEGKYIFEQINYRSQSSNKYFLYKYNGAALGNITVNNDKDLQLPNYAKETGSSWILLPPVKEIRLKYRYKVDANYLLLFLTSFSSDSFSEQELGILDQDAVVDIRLLLLAKLRWQLVPGPLFDPLDLQVFKFRFACVIRVGTKYLRRRRSNNLFYNVQYEDPTWVDTPDYYVFETSEYYSALGQYTDINDISILTSPIESSGTLRFNFYLLNVIAPDSANTGEVIVDPGILDFNPKWWLETPWLGTTLADGEPYLLTETNYRFNGQGKNTKVKEVEITAGDGPNTTNQRRIKIFNGIAEVESSGEWSPRGETIDISIQRLLLLEMAQILDKPLKVMVSNIIHASGFKPSPYTVFKIDEDRYIFMSGTITTTPGDFNGSWFYMDPEPIE